MIFQELSFEGIFQVGPQVSLIIDVEPRVGISSCSPKPSWNKTFLMTMLSPNSSLLRNPRSAPGDCFVKSSNTNRTSFRAGPPWRMVDGKWPIWAWRWVTLNQLAQDKENAGHRIFEAEGSNPFGSSPGGSAKCFLVERPNGKIY